jgi:hypothetical protein
VRYVDINRPDGGGCPGRQLVCFKDMDDGGFYSGTLTLDDSGTAANPVVVGSYGDGSHPTISTTNNTGIEISGSYVTVQDLHVTGSHEAGVHVTGDHVTVQGNEIDNSGSGVTIEGSNGLYTHNNVHDLHMVKNTPGGNDDYGATAFNIWGGSHNELSFNDVFNAKAPSYDYGQDGGGFEFYGSSSDTYIHDNTVRNSVGFMETGGESGDVISNVRVQNNIADSDGEFGWLHNDPDMKFGVVHNNFDISHNTVIDSDSYSLGGRPARAGYQLPRQHLRQ